MKVSHAGLEHMRVFGWNISSTQKQFSTPPFLTFCSLLHKVQQKIIWTESTLFGQTLSIHPSLTRCLKDVFVLVPYGARLYESSRNEMVMFSHSTNFKYKFISLQTKRRNLRSSHYGSRTLCVVCVKHSGTLLLFHQLISKLSAKQEGMRRERAGERKREREVWEERCHLRLLAVKLPD